jgi:hypothetical protein
MSLCISSTNQPVSALVGPAGTATELKVSFFADPPDGGAVAYDWVAVPARCVDLGEPLTDPDFKRVVTIKKTGTLYVKAYDSNGFTLDTQVVQVIPSA